LFFCFFFLFFFFFFFFFFFLIVFFFFFFWRLYWILKKSKSKGDTHPIPIKKWVVCHFRARRNGVAAISEIHKKLENWYMHRWDTNPQSNDFELSIVIDKGSFSFHSFKLHQNTVIKTITKSQVSSVRHSQKFKKINAVPANKIKHIYASFRVHLAWRKEKDKTAPLPVEDVPKHIPLPPNDTLSG